MAIVNIPVYMHDEGECVKVCTYPGGYIYGINIFGDGHSNATRYIKNAFNSERGYEIILSESTVRLLCKSVGIESWEKTTWNMNGCFDKKPHRYIKLEIGNDARFVLKML